MSFRDMKRNSNAAFEKLNSELSKINQGFSNNDDQNLWTCTRDKAGNGYAVIRFLPGAQVDGDDALPFIRLWSHGFKGPAGTWFIENCPTTLGGDHPCPVCESNNKLWNSGHEEDKKTVRDRKRGLNYYSNIYVVKDPANPENEGKVFVFRYGKKIFDKLNELMNPAEDPLDPKNPVNPFDFWAGANFKLKIRKVEGYANYDKSEFADTGPLLDDDDALEEIWKTSHSLKAIVDPSKFKTYTELSGKLNKVLNLAAAGSSGVTDDDIPNWNEAPKFKEKAAVAPKETSFAADDDDDDLAFFKNALSDD